MLNNLVTIASTAGEEILKIYNSENFSVEIKDDSSPLTIADKNSHKIIIEQLSKNFPDIPIISEEGKDIPFEERNKWKKFFLVDPLDGTKEFIKRNGEFTVNIALIENNKPVLGVIHIPVLKETYYGMIDGGAFKIDENGIKEKISVSAKNPEDAINVVQSRSHSGEEENEFYSQYNINERVSKGSSLKICLVAEGKAEIYFRSGPTWEWDTAAGHAILLSAGGYFINKNKSNFNYNKESLLNPGFIASSFEIL